MEKLNLLGQTAAYSLADYTTAESLMPRLKGRTVRGVMEELVRALNIPAHDEAVRAGLMSLNCELLTGPLDLRVIIVPVRWPAESRPRFALARPLNLLEWRASPLSPIEFVVLFVDPSPGRSEGTQVLAALDRLNKNLDRLRELRAAPSGAVMLTVLAHLPVAARERDGVLPPRIPTPEVRRVVSLPVFGSGVKGMHRRSEVGNRVENHERKPEGCPLPS